ncbi:MAG: hypothetical protein ACTSPV_03990 [Candidatus Hodarchaeales archaeon]
MCRSKQHKNSPRTHLYPNDRLNKCSVCEKPVIELYSTKTRKIRRLGRIQKITEHIFGCVNPDCPKAGQKLYPQRQTPPRSSYHFEVIREVGRLRKQEHKTFQEISAELQRQQVKIGANASCARHLFHYYEIYEMIWAEQDLEEQCQGQDIVMAIDGAKPENGVATLYLVTDALKQEVYGSDWLLYSGTEQIIELLSKIKALDLNVVGFVSDKQRALLLAVQEVFGEIPHQYCQFHWFKDAGSPLTDLDRSLNKFLKKKLRKLRDLTRAVERRVNKGKLPSHNLSILKELEPFLTVILQAKNKPPFVLKGLQNWQRAKLLLAEILNILSDARIAVFEGSSRSLPPSYKSLIMSARILADTLENSLFDVWNVQQASSWIYNLNNLLNPETQPLEWVKETHPAKLAHDRFQRFITQAKTFGSCFLSMFKIHVKDSFNRWSSGLLVCFNHPSIPRTNNSLENYVYLLKNRQTKTSGRRNNHSTLRHQQCFRFVLTIPSTKQFITSCKHTPVGCYHRFRQSYFDALSPIIKEHRIKRDFR